jgi:hypothetical protein
MVSRSETRSAAWQTKWLRVNVNPSSFVGVIVPNFCYIQLFILG